jgi:hypothetical protein
VRAVLLGALLRAELPIRALDRGREIGQSVRLLGVGRALLGTAAFGGGVGVRRRSSETRYARAGEDRVAYQVFGAGDIDLLFTANSGDAMEMRWYWPPYAEFLRRLGSSARVIMFDRRGMGSSDPASGAPLTAPRA